MRADHLILPAVIAAALFLVTPRAAAQSPCTENTLRLDEGSEPAPARVEDLAWLAGHWRGEALGGEVEEVWSPPRAGGMVGTFRHFREGALQFFEIVYLVQEGEHVVMRVKHFEPDFTGWEEKEGSVDFPLIRIEGERAYFDRLTLERTGPDGLKGYLVIHYSRRDETVEEVFTYRRYDPREP